jgi:hypothetical protein
MKIAITERISLTALYKKVLDNLSENQKKIVAGLEGKVFNQPAKAEMVPLDKVWIETYQRDLYLTTLMSHIVDVGGFDWNLFGSGTFAKSNNEQYSAIDCMHRLIKIMLIAPEISEVPGTVLGLPYEEQAIHFDRVNGALTKDLKAEETFRARVGGLIPSALKLKNFIEKCDLSCGHVNSENSNRSVSYATIEKVSKWPKAESIVPFISKMCKDGFGDKFSNQAFAGLCKLATFDMPKYGSYVKMFESDNTSRRKFYDWFTTSAKNTWTSYNDLIDKGLRNETNDWDVGIAYNVMQKFLAKNRIHGVKVSTIGNYFDDLKVAKRRKAA